MVEKGKIVAKKAYADWGRYSSYTEALHEAAIELIQIPRRAQTGKNSADIRLCVDAMDLAYSKEHIGTFVIVSGDSDFSPLVSKLKELGKHVIGSGDAAFDVGPVARQLRRIHLLRRPRNRSQPTSPISTRRFPTEAQGIYAYWSKP